jgi:hypothetical protein
MGAQEKGHIVSSQMKKSDMGFGMLRKEDKNCVLGNYRNNPLHLKKSHGAIEYFFATGI